MIKKSFIGPQRKIISFEIVGRRVIYSDEIWKNGIQIYPKDDNLIRKLIRSSQPNLKMMAALIMDANAGKDYDDYVSCKSEQDILAMITKDCLSKGLLEVK